MVETDNFLIENIHPNNLICPKCRHEDVKVWIDVNGHGFQKKVECKKCNYNWVVESYGKNV
jgi:transposase-like protein